MADFHFLNFLNCSGAPWRMRLKRATLTSCRYWFIKRLSWSHFSVLFAKGSSRITAADKHLSMCSPSIFTARRSYASTVLGVVILPVCPSDTRCFVTKPERTANILISHEMPITLSFLTPTMVTGHFFFFCLKFAHSDPPLRKNTYFDIFPLITSQP